MNESIMGGTVAVAGAAQAREPILQRMVNRIFRCSHRHKSHALTPRGETQRYAVCLDCGARLIPNLAALTAETPVRRSPRAAFLLGLIALALASASVFLVNRRSATIAGAGGRTEALLTVAGVAPLSDGQITGKDSSLAFPESSGKAESSAIAALEPNVHFQLPAHEIQPAARLESKGSIVVLARDAASALDLAQHPAKLAALIQSGALFAVSRGTNIKICESTGRISEVQILDGIRRGQQGWVPTWQIATP